MYLLCLSLSFTTYTLPGCSPALPKYTLAEIQLEYVHRDVLWAGTNKMDNGVL